MKMKLPEDKKFEQIVKQKESQINSLNQDVTNKILEDSQGESSPPNLER